MRIKDRDLQDDPASVNACSRVIPFGEVYRKPAYGAGALYVVDSTKEIVTPTDTRIAAAKVGDIHFGFDITL